jgi:high-affinity iron transporter
MGDLWSETEQIWEGVFSAIASVLIFIMGIAFLKMDRSRIKWRYKLAVAFEKSHSGSIKDKGEAESQGGKWALFMLPFVTVLREGLEAVVFVGGVRLQVLVCLCKLICQVSLNQPASSIPLATLAGLLMGGVVGWLIYRTGSTSTLHWFLVSSTCLLFLIGAGLASKAVGFFEYYSFSRAVGGDVAETGDGPGSFKVQGNMWHFTWGNPEVCLPYIPKFTVLTP